MGAMGSRRGHPVVTRRPKPWLDDWRFAARMGPIRGVDPLPKTINFHGADSAFKYSGIRACQPALTGVYQNRRCKAATLPRSAFWSACGVWTLGCSARRLWQAIAS